MFVAALMEEVPAVVTVQQQQAEQMKVFWKVCPVKSMLGVPLFKLVPYSLLKECSEIWELSVWIEFKRC